MADEYVNSSTNNDKKIWDKYGIPTAIAVAVNLLMNKAPSYLRKIGEEREKRRLEMEEVSEKRRMAYVTEAMKEVTREVVRSEIEKYKNIKGENE
jgi:hypothetical protein